MSISTTISKELIKVEKILLKSGLYKQFSYTETTSSGTYNPATASYDSSRGTTYTFNAVPLGQQGNTLTDSAYAISMEIVAIPTNLEFELRAGQEFVIGGVKWDVTSFRVSPENSLYEITLGRK